MWTNERAGLCLYVCLEVGHYPVQEADAGGEVTTEESRHSLHQLDTNLGHNVFIPALK